MHEGSRSTPQLVDLWERKILRGRIILRVWWTLVITGTVALILVTTGLDRVLPGAGTALSLGLRWVVGLAYAGQAALAWTLPLPDFGWGWKLGSAVVAALFLVRAALATYVALS